MVDKYRLIDNPKTWRIRNDIKVPKEYLDILEINGYRLVFLTGCCCLLCFIFGYSFNG